MSLLHICCNLAGSTVFPQMFEALAAQGISQQVFVPEKRPEDMGKNLPGTRWPPLFQRQRCGRPDPL